MTYYDDALTRRERNALLKHLPSLRDEIALLRSLLHRHVWDDEASEAVDDPDMGQVIDAAKAIAILELALKRLETKPDDAVRLALLAALNQLDADEATQ